MYLGGRANGGARVTDAVLLANGYGRTDSVNLIDVRFLHPFQKLPRIRRQGFNVATLTFGVHGVEGERRFSGTTHASDDDKRLLRQRQVDVLKIVGTCTPNGDLAVPVGYERRHLITSPRCELPP